MWGRVDPDDARDLFIRHALIEGDWDSDHTFRPKIANLRAYSLAC